MLEKTESLLGLPPLNNGGGFDSQETQLALTGEDSAKHEIIRIGDDNLVFKANVESISSRAYNSINANNKIIQYTCALNNDTASIITAITEDAKGSPHEDYVKEFNTYMIRHASQSNAGYAKISAAKIAQELSKPVLPPIFNEKPRGFLARLLTD